MLIHRITINPSFKERSCYVANEDNIIILKRNSFFLFELQIGINDTIILIKYKGRKIWRYYVEMMEDIMNLLNDYKKYCNLIHLKNNQEAQVLYETEHSLVIYMKDMDCTFIACDNQKDVKDCLLHSKIKGNSSVCIQNEEVVKELPPLNDIFICCNHVYDKSSFNFVERNDCIIKTLDISSLEFVTQHYDGYKDLEYISQRLATNNLWGIFVNDKISGFIGYHDEGSMGFLYVLPECRNKGLALYLESFLINKTINDGKIAFCQVHPDNKASIALQEKIGMSKSQNIITWAQIPSNFKIQ